MVIPTGPVNAVKPKRKYFNKPPASATCVASGANTVITFGITPTNIPPNVNKGPAATANTEPTKPTLVIIVCIDGESSSNHCFADLTLSTTLVKNSPNFTPHSSALSPKLSRLPVKSLISGFNCEKKPPPLPPASKNDAPKRPTAAHMFDTLAVNDS